MSQSDLDRVVAEERSQEIATLKLKAQQGQELATLALDVLDAQQRYFKTREKDDLIASKKLEKRLREMASNVLR